MDLPRPAGVDAVLDELTAAVRRVEQVEVRYWTASRDEVTERTITPRRIFSDHGDWYVVADDQRSGERRTFRVDRIEALRADGRLRRARRRCASRSGDGPAWFADGGLPQVTLRLRPEARWATERYPVDEVREDRRGRITATFPVASRPWLERLLVRLGPAAEVVAPAAWKDARRGRGDAHPRPLLSRIGRTHGLRRSGFERPRSGGRVGAVAPS